MDSSTPETSREIRRWPRYVELAMAVIALAISAIPMSLAAALVCAVLGRPVMFKQTRAGLGMRPFTIKKFRTMFDIYNSSGGLLPDHLRATPAMRFLRRTRLDELPQLLSIVGGDMAFVGPRPLLPSTILEMGELGRLRCRVRPGLTGWAQINGNTKLSDKQKLALDIWYVDHWSFLLDLRILVQTIVTIIRGERVVERNVKMAEDHLSAWESSQSKTSAARRQCA